MRERESENESENRVRERQCGERGVEQRRERQRARWWRWLLREVNKDCEQSATEREQDCEHEAVSGGVSTDRIFCQNRKQACPSVSTPLHCTMQSLAQL